METEVKEALDPEITKILRKIANSIRHLSIDAIQKANSGHPGLPLGCAELGAYLYGCALKHNPKNASWMNRDRFILSAGHGSMFLYSCLHLSGFNISLEDIQNFRQLNSNTPGHPENLLTEGVETTTGPLGQGVALAIGQALAMKLLGARFNTEEHQIFDNKIYILAGDGDFMEGISAEASSLAGHLKLNNVILIYDYNRISLDGPLSESCSEDVKMRYKAYGWDVVEINGHDFEDIHATLSAAKENQKKPTLVIANTIIGKGSPSKAGTHKVHGAPLGAEEVAATKKALDLSDEKFFIPQAVKAFFERKLETDTSHEESWNKTFDAWKTANPDKYSEFKKMKEQWLPENLESLLKEIKIEGKQSGRKTSNDCLNHVLAETLPQLYGGSADLSCSDLTMIKQFGIVAPGFFTGRNIKYGVREFAMGAISTGMAQTGLITPFCGTFLVFSDYMRNSIRLAALMKEKVIYQFTHDSIFLGEDGPTHQPIEHLASLRAIPNLYVIRPADSNEVKMSWLAALKHRGPTVLALSRQKLSEIKGTDIPFSDGVGKGAYIIKKEKEKPDYTFFATGSELFLAVEAAAELEKLGKDVRVVSMPCWKLFERQGDKYKDSIIGGDLGKRVSIEAGVEIGWHKYIGHDGIAIAMESFGASAPAGMLAREFGFTVESILERIL